jgi:hypothetical protein
MYLFSNQVSGGIPPEFGALNVYNLDLSNNQLSGSIPPELGNMPNLTNLMLSGNQLTGSIPDSFGNPANLRVLLLYNNQLSGNIPASLGQATNLETCCCAIMLGGGFRPRYDLALLSRRTMCLQRSFSRSRDDRWFHFNASQRG